MAVRYAVATGNWSSTSTWNGGTLPTSADDVYANGFTVTIDQNVTVFSIRNTAQTPAVAGGGFVLNDGFTLAGNLFAGATNLLTYSGTTSATVQGTVNVGANTIVFNTVSGTLNVIGNIINNNNAGFGIRVQNTGRLNIVGDVYSLSGSAYLTSINIVSNATINITGNIYTSGTGVFSSQSLITINSQCTLNISGNVTHNSSNGTSSYCIILNTGSANSIINITGSVIGGDFDAQNCAVFVIGISIAIYLNIVGSISVRTNGKSSPVINSSYTSINLFSGPFISSASGAVPFQVSRMHYIKTLGSYFEFRDSSTNGALPPAAAAPATRLVSPDTVVDAPIPSNVRNGVSYALGTFTGTLKVPNPNSVAFGVETDNTVGNAVLTPNAVWNHLTANITTANSIGDRLKNASTVETTGDQLAALL
jgi:hypothetical protein